MSDAYPSVLIVDDNQKIGLLVIEIFRRLGFHDVQMTTNVQDALSILRSGQFGLIVSDLILEPEDGIELLKKVKSDENLFKIAFILTETAITFEQVNLAYSWGVDAFLLKPFDVTLLKSKLKIVLKRNANRRRITPEWSGREVSDVA